MKWSLILKNHFWRPSWLLMRFNDPILGIEKVQGSDRQLAEFDTQKLTSEQVRDFIGETRVNQKILVLPRSAIIQKQMQLDENKPLSDSFQSELEKLFPYSRNEIAFGCSTPYTGRVLVSAIPLKRLNQLIDVLERNGIKPDEIISEDYAYAASLLLDDMIALDQDTNRVLAVVSRQGHQLYSRSGGVGALGEICSEISDLMNDYPLERKVILTGNWSKEGVAWIEARLSCSVQIRALPNLNDAASFDTAKTVSLLPHTEKVLKWQKNLKRQIRKTGISAVVFTASIIFFLNMHLGFLSRNQKAVEHKVFLIQEEVKDLKKMTRALNEIYRAEGSKKIKMNLLKDLARSIPKEIQLNELQLDHEIVFRGQSPSHAQVSMVVEEMQKMKMLTGVKLEHSRFRKKIGQEYVEFELSAKWA